ncbi:uncharacterized protein FIBRA_09112 [Fibroporia radiculosa]|uniref:Heme haloperoxidase family profile domain-containing protein n=1 Tax=Fibroporia radiculosa TaxID=599839 RepID=J4ICQ3_9APHY|nr:uncharacterized protein FIBRA_09112 [Fibroporia radiculosa]CCM06811.1 predicted protein [Fibroporia radiculosa]
MSPFTHHAHAHAHTHSCHLADSSTDNTHAYCPPQEGDSRSPCPALNTLANHGYLPRDGKCITPQVLINGLRDGYHLSTPLAWFLTHGGFYLLGQRRKRICLRDLSRHNCIEHDASLVHPDVHHRDEYAPVDMHLHMLEDLMTFAEDGVVMTPDDVARARVCREASYTIPLDPVHAEIARGEMAIALQLFNNPAPAPAPHPDAPDARSLMSKLKRIVLRKTSSTSSKEPPLPGVPIDMLRVWMHEERLPDGWRPYHKTGLIHTIRMSSRLRASMKALAKEQYAAQRAAKKKHAPAVAIAVSAPAPALKIVIAADDPAPFNIDLEQGMVGDQPLADARPPHARELSGSSTDSSALGTAMTRASTMTADSPGPATPTGESGSPVLGTLEEDPGERHKERFVDVVLTVGGRVDPAEVCAAGDGQVVEIPRMVAVAS